MHFFFKLSFIAFLANYFIIQITNKTLIGNLFLKILLLKKADNSADSLKEEIKTSSFRQKSLEKSDDEIDYTLRIKLARFLLTLTDLWWFLRSSG